jgi:chromosome segregation ATPase
MTDGEAREMARELVRGSIIEDAASQFIAQILKHAHDERIKPLRDRIEALIAERDQHWDSFVHWRKEADSRSEQLAAAREDAKEAEAYAEELEANALANRVAIMRLEAKLAKAVEALESVMVGGNHLAILLPDTFPPAETKPLDALEIMGAGDSYEVWCCWRSIMLARATLAELTGGKDE